MGFEHAILASERHTSNGIASYFGAPGKKKLWPSISEITNCKGFKFVYWISFYLAQSLQIYRVQEINFFPLKISKTKLPHVHASIQNGHTTAHQLYFWRTTLNLKTLWYTQTLLFITFLPKLTERGTLKLVPSISHTSPLVLMLLCWTGNGGPTIPNSALLSFQVTHRHRSSSALQTQHKFAEIIKYTIKWFRLRSAHAFQT